MKLWNVICKLQYYTYIQQKCGQKPKAQWNQSQKKQQKPKAKSQAKPKPKAKSQMGMQIGSKLQQIVRKSEILAPAANTSQKEPEAKSQKPEAKSQKPEARSQKKMPKKIPLHI